MKTLTMTAVSAAFLLGAAGASADTLWTIGSQDGNKSEFTYGQGFDGGDNVCSTPFVVGTTSDSNFPFELRSIGANSSDTRYLQSCETVTIEFIVDSYYANPVFNFWRMGGERTEILLGEESLATVGPNPVADPNPSTLYPVSLGEYLAPGSYTLTLKGAAIPTGADGYHWVDYLEVVGDPIEKFAKISGGFRFPEDTTVPGNSPSHAFDGYVAELGSGELVGQLSVNYRELKTTCIYSPTTSSVFGIGTAPDSTNVTSGIWARLRYFEGICSPYDYTAKARIFIMPKGTVLANRTDGVTDLDRGAVVIWFFDDWAILSDKNIDATPGAPGIDSYILLERGTAEVFVR